MVLLNANRTVSSFSGQSRTSTPGVSLTYFFTALLPCSRTSSFTKCSTRSLSVAPMTGSGFGVALSPSDMMYTGVVNCAPRVPNLDTSSFFFLLLSLRSLL